MIRNHFDYLEARYYAIKQGKELKDLTPEEMEMFRVQAKSIPVSNEQKVLSYYNDLELDKYFLDKDDRHLDFMQGAIRHTLFLLGINIDGITKKE